MVGIKKRVTLSIQIDSKLADYINEINTGNVSYLINNALNNYFFGEFFIKERVELLRIEETHLKKKMQFIKENRKKFINKIPEELKNKLKQVKEILERRPEKLGLWVDLVNRDFKTKYSIPEFKELIKKWG